VLTKLGKEPWEIARMGEDRAKELELRALPHDRARWIEVLVANPVLIERPILITDDGRAVLGRPPEAIESLLA
jgi:arsenate reductase